MTHDHPWEHTEPPTTSPLQLLDWLIGYVLTLAVSGAGVAYSIIAVSNIPTNTNIAYNLLLTLTTLILWNVSSYVLSTAAMQGPNQVIDQ